TLFPYTTLFRSLTWEQSVPAKPSAAVMRLWDRHLCDPGLFSCPRGGPTNDFRLVHGEGHLISDGLFVFSRKVTARKDVRGLFLFAERREGVHESRIGHLSQRVIYL